ncbi:MAG: glutamyl-tRNA reductase [Anaerolineales bacterium]
MNILCIGLNHTTAPLAVREKLALGEDVVRIALARIACGHVTSPFTELVLLSTCNRIELYAVSNTLALAELETFLSDVSGASVDSFRSHLYQLSDMQAVQHLFEVAAGLDSLVVGEPQILGQVTHALELARAQNTAGFILNRLFQAAIHAGKRTRTETAISRNPVSVSSLAASLSERVVHDISQAQIVILGAGEMAELAVEALRKRGAQKILVVNRTLERAHALAQRWNAQAATFEDLHRELACADILISSTGAPHTIISSHMVNEIMRLRSERPLVLIDIAVPRDIDPDVVDIRHVKLYDMDTLNAQLEHSLAERMAEVPQVKHILEEELARFEEYRKSLDMLPLIADLRQSAETIRQTELEKTLRHLPDLTEAERAHIEAMTQALVKKLLHAPTNRLRSEARSPRASEYADLTRTLFNLSDKHTHPTSTAAD